MTDNASTKHSSSSVGTRSRRLSTIAPQRDSAILGVAANTALSETSSIYLRYDGDIGSGADNHALSVGVRFSW